MDRLRELFVLDAERGFLIRRPNTIPGMFGGEIAGGTHSSGYLFVWIDRKQYAVHRIVYALAHGAWQPDGMHIDHANRVKTDNRPSNLRLATRSQNMANRKKKQRGVRLRANGKWEARLGVNNKSQYLGVFDTEGSAIAAYRAAAEAAYGDFAHV